MGSGENMPVSIGQYQHRRSSKKQVARISLNKVPDVESILGMAKCMELVSSDGRAVACQPS